LGPEAPVNRPEWSNGGRQKALSLKEPIEARGSLYQSDKCLMVMRGMFDYVIDRGWMQPPKFSNGVEAVEAQTQTNAQPFAEVGPVTQVL